ncbi:branched-chain amino acid ABC transporter permease [Faecalitalea cylindroides]|jgi:branched-chain amino acid transport system permease protein|uniref:Branched-chain amino acid ABC transporter permease n=3 Tax=Faecalitalea cylindroides TaxID=39483 RepID=A0A1Y4M0S3_9FIRM|nr:branched-chain amino acid ABC transporter permease [Faecalitalea cylindroides]MBM6653331.1 branched-chain amino acid ABC transporter permease [Faecalitalea cylindroides]MDC0827471.1 branched-chain amino acid ABC transporter permease [Faecalitalea cylindroides]OUN62971.1 branched-chain amino acid ABC transporter permease [Faecalitalea cylindroides]OUP60941.1 branched-chain amino acid ABC transporter permease [Faecalitalea cylindroides]
MIQFLQQMINGLSLGSIYALIALGYTMVYGIIKLINFAHGDIYMLGAFTAFYATTFFHLNFFVALIIAMLLCGVLGVLIERIAYKPLRHATRITALITAMGVSYVLEYTMQYFAGSDVKTFPTDLLENTAFSLGGVRITMMQIYIFVITIILMVLLTYIVNKTKMGRAMRAVSVDEDAAKLMGINVDTTISFTFFLGSCLAGVAGVLVGVYYNSINPLMGMTPGLKAFIAAVFGGIGNIPGAMIGGLFIGIAETLVTAYGSSLYKDAIVYVILILVLILKPDGLLGKNVKEKV